MELPGPDDVCSWSTEVSDRKGLPGAGLQAGLGEAARESQVVCVIGCPRNARQCLGSQMAFSRLFGRGEMVPGGSAHDLATPYPVGAQLWLDAAQRRPSLGPDLSTSLLLEGDICPGQTSEGLCEFCGCCDQVLKTEIDSLAVLDAGSLTAGCRQGQAPSEGGGSVPRCSLHLALPATLSVPGLVGSSLHPLPLSSHA